MKRPRPLTLFKDELRDLSVFSKQDGQIVLFISVELRSVQIDLDAAEARLLAASLNEHADELDPDHSPAFREVVLGVSRSFGWLFLILVVLSAALTGALMWTGAGLGFVVLTAVITVISSAMVVKVRTDRRRFLSRQRPERGVLGGPKRER